MRTALVLPSSDAANLAQSDRALRWLGYGDSMCIKMLSFDLPLSPIGRNIFTSIAQSQDEGEPIQMSHTRREPSPYDTPKALPVYFGACRATIWSMTSLMVRDSECGPIPGLNATFVFMFSATGARWSAASKPAAKSFTSSERVKLTDGSIGGDISQSCQ